MFPFLDDLGFLGCNGSMSAAHPKAWAGRRSRSAGRFAPGGPPDDLTRRRRPARRAPSRAPQGQRGWLRAPCSAPWTVWSPTPASSRRRRGRGGPPLPASWADWPGSSPGFSMAAESGRASTRRTDGRPRARLRASRLLRRPDAEKAGAGRDARASRLVSRYARGRAHEIAAGHRPGAALPRARELGISIRRGCLRHVSPRARAFSRRVRRADPLLPILFGSTTLWLALVCAGVAAVPGGGLVSQLTTSVRSAVRSLQAADGRRGHRRDIRTRPSHRLSRSLTQTCQPSATTRLPSVDVRTRTDEALRVRACP